MTSLPYGPVFDLATWHDASMPVLSLPNSIKALLDGGIKERQSQKPLVRNTYTFERSSVSFEELHFILQNFQNL
jgi:hypothetical protein